MITTDLTTLRINKLTQDQYETALAAGNIDENQIYLTPTNFTITYGTTDLIAGVSDLAEGTFYFVYE